MRKKIFTFLLALAASVGMSWADTYVTITQNDFPESGHSFTKDGVTVSVGSIDRWDGRLLGGGSFSTTLGNFTHIEVMAGDVWSLGEGWSGDDESQIWSGNASSVSFSGDILSMGQGITLLFTIGEPLPTYTVALKAGTANANKVTLSATSAVEGATITVTPDEEYEITAFKAKYNTTQEAPSTLDPATGAYSFTMPAYAVTIEATIALKPVPEGDIYAGFTPTAGSGGFTNEGSANLVDNKFTSGNEGVNWTKWCANDGHKSVPTGESESCWWIDFEADAALSLTGYILTTGNDTGSEHGRNPKNWLLKAKLNADDAWTTIATVTNDVTMKNKSFKDYKFFVDQSGTYKYFRFEVSANQGANVMQLCELRLIGAEPVVVTTHTLQLHVNDALMGSVALQDPSIDIIDNGDGTYTVPDGASVTLNATPNEGYEFIGWKASSSICDFNDCEFTALPTVENPLTFDMYNEAAFMAEFAAVAPQPEPQPAGDGKLTGAFTINADGDQIVFSQGNLQYQASTTTWRFATNQYDMIGADNANISDTYTGWIDLFGWGTGNCPTKKSTDDEDYSTFTDWGVNAISNGGNEANLWRTLTRYEWNYLIKTRTNADNLKGQATVADVHGYVLLPDSWTLPAGLSFSASPNNWTTNVYTAEQWAQMEAAGAVFLPATGYRNPDIVYVDEKGWYWSSDVLNGTAAYDFEFTETNSRVFGSRHYFGQPVRLVTAYDAPAPQPAEDVNITPNVDPDHAGVYYSTFFDSANKYALPAGVEAYVADLSGANLLLTKIANAGQTIPANVAVILKSTVTPFTLSISDAEAVTFTATNDLQGTDVSIATPDNCYVLAGEDGVGFYHYTASMLNPHKAYVIYSGSNQAPKRMPFVFNQATGVDQVPSDQVQSTKILENGVLYIIKNGVKYNAQGQVIK